MAYLNAAAAALAVNFSPYCQGLAARGSEIIQIHRRQHHQSARLLSQLLCVFVRSPWGGESRDVCTKPLHVASRHPILIIDVANTASMRITLAQMPLPPPPPPLHTHRGPHGNAPAHCQPQACQENVHSRQGMNGTGFRATPALCVLKR
mgnify:FL=1